MEFEVWLKNCLHHAFMTRHKTEIKYQNQITVIIKTGELSVMNNSWFSAWSLRFLIQTLNLKSHSFPVTSEVLFHI